MLYFIFHWISSVYETCGVSLFFISSCTIFNNNIMKSKPKKSLRMVIRQFLSRVIVTFEAMFELSCNIATIMTGLNFKSRIQIKVCSLFSWPFEMTNSQNKNSNFNSFLHQTRHCSHFSFFFPSIFFKN